jgi:dTDP-4-dehydrorhamnose reductase
MVEKTKILITGSSGMLGSSLCEALADEYEISGLDLFEPQASNPKPQAFSQCDIADKHSVVTVISKVKPDLIIHTAAYTDVDGSELNRQKAFAVNAQGTENVVQAARGLGAILFYISTDYVFDGKKDKPYTETDLPHPINIYGQSKLEGEKIIQARLDKYFILRTSWLYGPNGKNFVTTILEKARENKILKIVDDQIGSPTYNLDLAKAIKVLLSNINAGLSASVYGIYHITNSASCSWYEFAKRIISLKQLETEILPISSSEAKRPALRPKMSVLDNSKLKATFRLNLRPWPEALNHFLLSLT